MFPSKIFGTLPKAVGRLVAIAALFGAIGDEALAGIWTQPTATGDKFLSKGIHTLVITAPGSNIVTVPFVGYGPTNVVRDNLDAAFPQDGKDTINTEITNFHLIGNAGLFYAETIAGAGGTFFNGGVGLDYTRGQIQDDPTQPPPGPPPSPFDGIIQLPAKSIFDVFFDVWVDGVGGAADGIVQVGEVFSNDLRTAGGAFDPLSYALTMMRDPLLTVPPTPYVDVYTAVGKVSHLDPHLGTFEETLLLLPLDLYPINPDRTLFTGSSLQVQLVGAVHIPIPEIDAASGTGALSLLAGALALAGERRRRKAA